MPVGTVWQPKDATCKDCNQPIAYRLTNRGKWQPWDPALGDVHYASCAGRLPVKAGTA